MTLQPGSPSSEISYEYDLRCVCVLRCVQLFCDPIDCSPPGSSVHEIFQGRILQWVAFSSSRGSSWPRDWTCISCISYIGRRSTTWESVMIWGGADVITIKIKCVVTVMHLNQPSHPQSVGKLSFTKTVSDAKNVGDNLLAGFAPSLSCLLGPNRYPAKKCSNYCTIALISHASKVILKILQVRLQ